MRISGRVYAFLAILAALVAVVALVGRNGGAFAVGGTLSPIRSVNLIAYVGLGGQVFTVRPDDSDVRQTISPDEGFFTWPVWSPDASRIAFSGLVPGADGSGTLVLYLNDLDGDPPRALYTNEPGMGPILNGMPHYPLWSPDGTRLAFMASVPQGLTLFLDDVLDAMEAEVVLRNSPLYASWSGDSRYMLVHAGPDHFLVDAATGASVGDLSRRATGYRAPAWQPGESKVAILVQEGPGAQNLYLDDVESGERTLIDSVAGNAAFLWSPDGKALAVAKSDTPGVLPYQTLSIFSPDGERQATEAQGNLIAYFWSPDSSKLAFLTFTRTRGVLRWMMLDVESGDTWPLADFTPTQDQATVFQFFDQFAHSHSLWSPDSTSLVFSGNLRASGVPASLNQQPAPQVYVMDVSRDPDIRPIAEGFLAFWSPR